MSFLQTVAEAFLGRPEDFKTLSSEFPDLDTQLAAIRAARANQARVYRIAGVQEALGVPSILAAVTLISGTVGRLSMEAYLNGTLVTNPDQIPRLIIRPNPRSTPREFFRDSTFYLATRGEVWWYVAKRDADGNALSLVVVPPWEVQVEKNDRDRFSPTIRWLDVERRPEDLRQITYMPDHSGLRGVGPLQMAGAAVSVATEADAWAANFFSGALPSLIGTTEADVDELDLKALDAQWAEKPNNLPRWMTNGLKLEAPPYDAQRAQLTESRQFQVGEVARMFTMPGSLIEYQMPGSSLTYRSEPDIWVDFKERCLSPHYLEPIEQEMTDLLTRSYTTRFNTWELTKADPKTRYEVYGIGIDKGIFGPEYPQKMEGMIPGDVNYAPVPQAPPAAVPTPIRALSMEARRCVNPKCKKLLADVAPPGWKTTCPRCGIENSVPLEQTAEHSEILGLTAALRAVAEPPVVNVPPQPAPIIQLPVQPAPIVNVHTDSFTEAVQHLEKLMTAPRTRTVLRDEHNNIIGSKEEIA